MMIATLCTAVVLAAAQAPALVPSTLGGTSWQLVVFHGADGTTVKPDDGSKYTLKFNNDGKVVVRVDCNRGSARWTSGRPGQIELGTFFSDRVHLIKPCSRGAALGVCPPRLLHDHRRDQRDRSRASCANNMQCIQWLPTVLPKRSDQQEESTSDQLIHQLEAVGLQADQLMLDKLAVQSLRPAKPE